MNYELRIKAKVNKAQGIKYLSWFMSFILRKSIYLLPCYLKIANRTLILFIGLLLSMNIHAQKHHSPADSSAVVARMPAQSEINNFKKLPEYQYEKDVLPPSPTLWDTFWYQFWKWINTFFSDERYGTTRSVLTYLMIGGTILFVIFKLIGVNITGIFSKKSTSLPINYNISNEDIHSIPYQEAIAQAIAQHNYRLAIRLQYLQSLKVLSDKHLIDWQIDKTNRTYTSEITPTLHNAFEHITQQFEYVWYGNFNIDERVYRQIKQDFDSFMVNANQ
jgi:Domain of unknown function (DUF4129)